MYYNNYLNNNGMHFAQNPSNFYMPGGIFLNDEQLLAANMTRAEKQKKDSENIMDINEINQFKNVLKAISDLKINPLLKEKFDSLLVQKYSKEWEEIKKYKDKDAEIRFLVKCFSRTFDSSGIYPRVTKNFDKAFFPHGLMSGELYTITADSGIGKTALVINMTTSIMMGFNPFFDHNYVKPSKVLYISLEQTKDEIRGRIESTVSAFNDIDTAIPFANIIFDNIKPEMKKAYYASVHIVDMFKENLQIADSSVFDYDLSSEKLYSKIKEIYTDYSFDVIILDQIVNVESIDENCDNKTPLMLKRMATELKKPIIVLTQLSKESSKNAKQNVSKLSGASLRGSSFLEFQSSLILAIGVNEANNEESPENLMDIRSLKARSTKKCQIEILFIPEVNVFKDVDSKYRNPDDQKVKKINIKKNEFNEVEI